ncbi:hypothetical protein [Elizabethkingia anophelis]|uniref:hypothetical protein n=1 Tax=Elizabethkingia anophelis TaxID=1117645 RepID=UPI003892042F
MGYNTFFDILGTTTERSFLAEDFNDFTAEYTFSSISLPSEENLHDLFSYIRDMDNCSVFFSIDQGEAVTFKKDSQYTQFLDDLKILISSHEIGEIFRVKISVYKKSLDNQFYFYSQECFFNYIKSFDSYSLAAFFSSSIFDPNSRIYIQINDFVGTTRSNKFLISANYESQVDDFEYRRKRTDNIISNNHSSFFGKLKVLPEDFIFTDDGVIELQALEQFKKLAKILLISSIFDITDLSKEHFTFKLNGYKSISGSFCTKDISTNNLEDYYKIYQWIYNSGNIVDKIGLARNIISLHLKKESYLELEGDVYESLKSSYKIYEKQNIKQYIEVRNKMSDQILDYSKRVVTITDNFASGFQRSALSLVTFFSSLIVSKILATPKNNSDFIFYSTIITFVFIGVTFAYMMISRAELKEQKNRFIKSYKDFKKRYTDLLTREDIERILNNDEEHKSDLSFIAKKMRWYTTLWIIVLVLILIATLIYYCLGNVIATQHEIKTSNSQFVLNAFF